ncbi:MAG: calcium/sodium antiporter [Chloroflexia bacterium]|nr:calcium/sodium antiporter [Chloroflexia bacterium]
MSILTLILFAIGFVLLLGGAELLVRGASHIAAVLGISPLVIGLTVVSFGTSAPELAVSFRSSMDGQSAIALGNVVGSNIFNVLFILGLSAIIVPLAVDRQLIRLDVPLMIGISLLMFGMAFDQHIGRIDGLIMVTALIAYLSFSIYQSRCDHEAEEKRKALEHHVLPEKPRQLVLHIFFAVAGLGLLALGAQWLVDGAVTIARFFGLSELIIGLTIIAVGTSLPEVAASLVAALRGQRDIAVGNVIGSNIFNILAILGLTGLLIPNGVNIPVEALRFDLPVMILVSFACLPILFTGYTISRGEGVLLFGYYLAYTGFLILNAMQHNILALFSSVLGFVILPITLVGMLVFFVRALRRQGSPWMLQR